MEVTLFKAAHMASIEPQEAQLADLLEIRPEALVLAEKLYSFTIIDAGKPVACLGIIPADANMTTGFLWAYLDKRIGRKLLYVHRFARHAMNVSPFKRFEAHVKEDFEPGHHWVRLFGFQAAGEAREYPGKILYTLERPSCH